MFDDTPEAKTRSLNSSLTLRLSSSDTGALERLASKYPVLKSTALAREALRIGLAAIESDPSVLLRDRR